MKKENRKQGKQRKGISKMKAATARQIENMKKQTIGVEVEMYGISRRDAAASAADFFGTGTSKTRQGATATALGAPRTTRDASGNSSATSASKPQAAPSRPNWSRPSCTTRTSSACRNF